MLKMEPGINPTAALSFSADGHRFVEHISSWLPGIDTIAISAVGTSIGERRLLFFAQVVLCPSAIQPPAVGRVEGGPVWAVRTVSPFAPNSLPELVSGALEGNLLVDGMTASLPKLEGGALNSTFHPVLNVQEARNLGQPRSIGLLAYRGSVNNVIREAFPFQDFEWQLRAMTPPFFDFADLLVQFGFPAEHTRVDGASIALIAQAPIGIEQKTTRLDKGRATVHLTASERVPLDRVSLSLRAYYGPSKFERGVVPSDAISWSRTDEKMLGGVVEVDVGDVPSAQFFLTLNNRAVQAWWVFDPVRVVNPAYARHIAFDPDLSLLRWLLFDLKRDSRQLEDGVAMLLAMFGFSVNQYGRGPKTSDGPDILAVTGQGNIAVVECTVGMPDQGGQYAQVLRRTQRLRASLNGSGWSLLQVLPVVVTALPENEIASHRPEAKDKGIVVAAKEQLETGLERVRFGVDAEQLFLEAFRSLETQGRLIP